MWGHLVHLIYQMPCDSKTAGRVAKQTEAVPRGILCSACTYMG